MPFPAPHCGSAEGITKMQGKSHRPDLFLCGACRGNFSVTVGTVYKRSHIPLHNWLLATHLMSSSKKGISTHQLLGEPLATKLRDFCAANYRAAALDVIRDALDEHIDRRLQNPEMRERYEKARRLRLELPEKIINLVKKSEPP